MINYSKLNQILDNQIVILKKNHLFTSLKGINKLALFYHEQIKNIKRKRKTYPPINFENRLKECALEIDLFLKDFDQKNHTSYSSLFRNLMIDPNKVQQYKDSFVSNTGVIEICFNGTIEDYFNLLHLFIIRLSYNESYSILKSYLEEVPAYTMEYLYQDYYHSKYTNKELSLLNEQRLLSIQKEVEEIIKEYHLIDLYLKKHEITVHDITNNDIKTIQSIIQTKRISLPYIQKYLLGIVLGTYLYQMNEPTTLTYLINVLTHTNQTLQQDFHSLSILGIPFINKDGINVTTNELQSVFLTIEPTKKDSLRP